MDKDLTCWATSGKIESVGQHERRDMNDIELANLLRSHGWTYRLRNRRKGTQYIYAVRRIGASTEDCYIAPLSKIGSLTPAQVEGKLKKKVAISEMTTAVNRQHCKTQRLTA